MRHAHLPLKQRQPKSAAGVTMLMLSGLWLLPAIAKEPLRVTATVFAIPLFTPLHIWHQKKKKRKADRVLSVHLKVCVAMDETDIMDLTHQKARKRPRPISSVDESVHASLKRLPMRAAECREPSLMFAVRGEPVPAASLKQNDHSVTSSPTTVMPAQVKRGNKVRYFCWGGRKRNNSLRLGWNCALCAPGAKWQTALGLFGCGGWTDCLLM